MNLTKVLAHLGFKPEDYTIFGSDFTMTQKSQKVVKTPAVYEEGEIVTEAEIIDVDVTPAKPSIEQLQVAWEEVQLSEVDITLLISKFIEGKERDFENDCFNVANGLLVSFDFTHIARPTNIELLALIPSIENDKQRQDKLDQIVALESSISPRRLREAVLSGDTSFIESIEQQILEIRNTL